MATIKESWRGNVTISRDLANRIWGLLAQECTPCMADECCITKNPAEAIEKCVDELVAALDAPQHQPTAWVVYATSGNVMLWSRNQYEANKCAMDKGLTVTPLYAHPAPSLEKLVGLWFDEWELILPPDARESYRNDLLASVEDALGVNGLDGGQKNG